MKARLCSDEGAGHPDTQVDVELPEGSTLRAYREPPMKSKKAFLSFRPTWINLSITDALRLRDELNRALRGRKAPRRKK